VGVVDDLRHQLLKQAQVSLPSWSPLHASSSSGSVMQASKPAAVCLHAASTSCSCCAKRSYACSVNAAACNKSLLGHDFCNGELCCARRCWSYCSLPA
jgi:hypothetical protein